MSDMLGQLSKAKFKDHDELVRLCSEAKKHIEQLQADKEDLERTIEEAIDFLRNDAYRTRVINALMILEAKQ